MMGTDLKGTNLLGLSKCAENLGFTSQAVRVDKEGFLGIFLGGFKNCALGLSAALVFSYLASLIVQPKMKKH